MKYYGYIDEDGDVIDMRKADKTGNGARVLTVDELKEELGDSYTVNEDTADIYQLNEAKLPKTSDPQEGMVYWDKKHEIAYYVVAVYPEEKNEKKQVSYWNDEGVRKTCSIEDFKKNMEPSKDVADYDIFEECSEEVNEEVGSDSIASAISKCLPSGFELEYVDSDYDDGHVDLYEIQLKGEVVGVLSASYAYETQGINLTISKDYGTESVLDLACGVESETVSELIKSAIPDIKKGASKIRAAILKLQK